MLATSGKWYVNFRKLYIGKLKKIVQNVYRWMEQSSRNFQPFLSYRNCKEIFFFFSKRCFTEYIRSVPMKESCWKPFNSCQSFISQKRKYRVENTKQAQCLWSASNHECGLPTVRIRSEFFYQHPVKTILLLRNCSRPPRFKNSIKAWSS